jgi:hypothetical protein
VDRLRRHPGITSLVIWTVGPAGLLASLGGDPMAVTVLELIAVLVAIGTYALLRRARAALDR